MVNGNDLGQIIAGCKRGDADCFSHLVDAYAGRCYGYFYRLTGDRNLSDDLLAEVFVRLVEKIGSYKGGSFDSWVFRIASNIFHDHLRAKLRQKKLFSSKEAEPEEMEETEEKTSDSTGDKIDILQKQLNRLDSDTKELIMLRFYSDLSFKEIATMREEPIGTTLSKLHRGLKRLRELME
jgi:RNA polymerase sigma-70 factor (ECF subfamily)